MKYLILGLLLIGCTRVEFETNPVGAYIDDDFANIVEGFRANTELWNDNIIIVFGNPGPDAGAGCYEGLQIILVKKSLWSTMSACYQEFIIMHELGHCVLGYEHDDSPFMAIGMPGEQKCNDNREENYKAFFDSEDVVLYDLPSMPETKSLN